MLKKDHMKPSLRVAFWVYGVLFVLSGIAVLIVANFPNTSLSIIIKPASNVVYALHLFCWMVLGMIANYFWDLFRENKTLNDVEGLCTSIRRHKMWWDFGFAS
jgi:hypothetical protein